MMTGVGPEYSASAAGNCGNGDLRRNTMVRSSGAAISSVTAIMVWPKVSRTAKRRMEATQSRARTGVSSWNSRPSRSVMRQVRPSFSMLWPATIWGCGWSASSRP